MRSCALTHAICLIQPDVQAQEKLHCFTTDRCCSREELLTARQAKLSPKLLQHKAVSQGKEEWFLITPKRKEKKKWIIDIIKSSVFVLVSHLNPQIFLTLHKNYSQKFKPHQHLLLRTLLIGFQTDWHCPFHEFPFHISTLTNSLFDLFHHLLPHTWDTHVGCRTNFSQCCYQTPLKWNRYIQSFKTRYIIYILLRMFLHLHFLHR